jgi:tetratricopeptide (TPR) repeat protein
MFYIESAFGGQMAKKKTSRKELLKEPDEFLTLSSRMLNFAAQHKSQLSYALSIIVVLLAIIAGYRFFAIRAENKAQGLLDQTVGKYETALKAGNAHKAFEDVSEDFQKILKKYSRQNSGKLARVIFANICYDGGEYGKAIELYQRALKDFESHPFIQNLILGAIGYAHEQLNQDPSAVSYFSKIIDSKEQLLRDEALFNLGVLYEKLGEKEKSTHAFEQVLSDHQDSIYIPIVKERLEG